jgi:RNA polymerase subunit RPABC4/transcription elongation factor Spt4
MPMIDCHECGKKISDYADACPKCGAKPKMPESRSDWVQYRCKSCDLMIKQKVDKCPNCDADQTGENVSQAILWGILLVVCLFLAAQCRAALR